MKAKKLAKSRLPPRRLSPDQEGISASAFSALVDAGFKAVPPQIQRDKGKLQGELEAMPMWQKLGDKKAGNARLFEVCWACVWA